MQPTDTCRSCGAAIRWAYTDRGKRMPLDAEPIGDGEWVVSAAGYLVKPLPLFESTPRYRSHYATCPDAGEWRGKTR